MIHLLLMLCAICAANQDPQGLAAAAERAYHDGRYDDASVFLQVAAADPEVDSATVLYDLGNCAYRSGRYAEAVWHYRCARLRRPNDRDLAWNLQLAEQRLGVQAPPIGLAARLDGLGRGVLLAIAVALETLGLLLCLAARGALRVTGLVVVLLGVLVGGWLVARTALPPAPAGIVLQDRVAVRREPHARMPAILQLAAGDTVTVLEWSDRWARIRHPTGGGWVPRDAVGLVE